MKKLLGYIDLPERFWLWILGILIVIAVGSCSQFFLGGDNPIEQKAESIIEETTGIDVDFSPKRLNWYDTWKETTPITQ